MCRMYSRKWARFVNLQNRPSMAGSWYGSVVSIREAVRAQDLSLGVCAVLEPVGRPVARPAL